MLIPMFSTSVLEKYLCSALQGPLLVRPSSASAPGERSGRPAAHRTPSPCATSNSTPIHSQNRKENTKQKRLQRLIRITYISRSLRFLLATVRVILVQNTVQCEPDSTAAHAPPQTGTHNLGGKRAKHNKIHSTRDTAYSHSSGNVKLGAKLKLLRALHRGVNELCNPLIPVRFGPATSLSLTAQRGKK